MIVFEDLSRTVEGRRLYEAQRWLNRWVVIAGSIWGAGFIVASIVLLRWLRLGVYGGRWIGFAYLALMALLLVGGVRFLRQSAENRPGVRCQKCGTPLIGHQLRSLLTTGACPSCGRPLSPAAA